MAHEQAISENSVVQRDGLSLANSAKHRPEIEQQNQQPASNKRLKLAEVILLFLIFIGVTITTAIVYYVVPVHKRGFSCSDAEIMQPFLDNETIPSWAAILSGVLILIISIVLTDFCNILTSQDASPFGTSYKIGKEKQSKKVHLLAVVKVVIVGLIDYCTVMFIVAIGKVVVGALRPDFLEMCFGNREGYINFCKAKITEQGLDGSVIPLYISADEIQCTHNSDEIEDERKSFPSGHAASICGPAFFAIIYINLELRHKLARCLSVIWQVMVIAIAFWISMSRVEDNKHHLRDVTASAVISLTVGLVFYTFLRFNPDTTQFKGKKDK
ncbi:phospholipid phosphatase 3-like isoform X2 [Convolutriloba macropyga]|uniref:phospholipid phosphatase 3-like isoform X2 n=1 Tax=Convolutriloba macropyga TaxID=536237 RepID=UPI003F5225AF